MATSTLGSGTLVLAGTTSGTTTVTATAVAGTTTLTLPAATDTLVGKATTDTLTNKTLTGAAMNGTLGATTPSTASVTTLTTSSTITHNGGTANGVAYLNGSKVLTTGTALVFDGANFLFGATSEVSSTVRGVQISTNMLSYANIISAGTSTSTFNMLVFINGNGNVGAIQTSGSTTTYATSSDYRLKESISPMTGALAKVAALKPVTYKWKVNGLESQGFIAHELQAIVPECVTGEKDAVDADGNIKPQGIDTSFLVATLTAAIQELNAKFEEYKAAHP